MRTPEWESSPGALATLLNSRVPLFKADVYTVTLPGGAVLRWTGSDRVLSFGGNDYLLGPKIKRGRVRFVVGVEVSTLDVSLWDEGSTQVNGKPLLAFVAARGLYGARIKLSRAFWGIGTPAPTGALTWFTGRVADTTLDRNEARIVVKSDLEDLDVMVPAEVYQPGCLNDVYDADCGADRAAFTHASTASAASNATRITFGHSLAQASGYFDLGVITFTSGPNAGISRTVKRHVSGGQFTVLQPWPFAVTVGDAFTATAGCNKSKGDANGCPKFHSAANVIVRFRGQPFIPVPETVF